MSVPAASDQTIKPIYLVPYPKVIFMYPTFLASIVAGIFMLVARNEPTPQTNTVSAIFLIIFGLNIVVFSFDFPRTTSLTLFFVIAAIALGLWVFFIFNESLLPPVTNFLRSLSPFANSTFFFMVATILFVVYLAVFMNIRFDYWEVRPNELLHHHGVLSNLERFAAPNLRIDKEINDVFEYFLLRTGRLILHPSNERRAIVLENVPFINRKEAEITRMLGSLQVRIGKELPGDEHE
ncbi:MAG: hypothetical protein AB7O26_11325 [Planctomycetaceae bacterium]